MSTLDDIAGTARPGTVYGIGVGPGDVRYMTLRAAGLIRSVDVLAYFAKAGNTSRARTIVAPLVRKGCTELELPYPVTHEVPTDLPDYREPIARLYRDATARIATELAAGRSVGIIAEGDPFFYGSFMHLWHRLATRFPCEVVPGVPGMAGAWTRAGAPITWGDDVLAVLPGTLPEADLARRLAISDAVVIMKVGRHLAKVRRALAVAGMDARAILVEEATMPGERVRRLIDVDDQTAPYFSIVLIPGQGRRL